MQFQFSYRKIINIKFLLSILIILAGYTSVWTQHKQIQIQAYSAEEFVFHKEFIATKELDSKETKKDKLEIVFAPIEEVELSDDDYLRDFKFFEFDKEKTKPAREKTFIKPEIQRLIDAKEKAEKSSIDEKIEAFEPIIQNGSDEKFHWKPAIKESLYFLVIQHGFRMFQEKTYTELDGPFFRDWGNSVKNLGGWRDGDNLITNYIAHPMQGAVTGRIFINNSDKDKKLEFGKSKNYWYSRLRTLAWSAVWSTQFELGPISEATIGNVGLYDRVGPNRMGWVDMVITPTAGTGVLIGEDIIDKYILKKWLEKGSSRTKIKALRSFLTPFQTFTNLLAGKAPWWRNNR